MRAEGPVAAFLMVLAGACGPDEGGLEDRVTPVILDVTVTESPANVLSATLEVETDVATTLEVAIDGGAHGSWVVPYDTGAGTLHVVPVLGLRAENAYDIEVTVTADGLDASETAVFETGGLPDDFPPIDATAHAPSLVASGVTIFPVTRWNPGPDSGWGYLVGIDEQGEVVWYHDHGASMGDTRLLSGDRIAVISGNATVTEIDALGRAVERWTADAVGIDTFHHELFELADGNFATLSTELRSISGYEGGSTTYDVVADVVVELDAAGQVVSETSMFDVLDPLRTRPGFDAGFWDSRYSDAPDGTKDWTHGNAVVHDPRDDSFIVSLRHQDWIIKIDRATGDLIWRLGEEGDFTMVGGGDWQYHQHAPEIQPEGTLLLYDNGNARTSLGVDDTPFSRAVEYDVDETSMQVELVWEYRNDTPYFAPFVGDADRLGNGNVLITDGGIVVDPDVPLADPNNQKWARILEVTHETPAEKVWEVVIRDNAAADPVGYHVYRATRIGSLYDAID